MDGPVLERGEGKRSFFPQTGEHVPAQAGVALDPCRDPGGVGTLAAAESSHPQGVEGQVGGRRDERDVLEKRAVPPHEPIEIGKLEATEARPQHEKLIPGDHVRRIKLYVPEMLDRVEDRTRRRPAPDVEALSAYGEATGVGEGKGCGYATATWGCFSGARSRKLTISSSDSGDSYDSMSPASESRAISGSMGSFAMSGAFEAMTSLRPCDGPKTSMCDPSGVRTYAMFSTIPRISPPSCLTSFTALVTTMAASACGVVTSTTPSTGSACITVSGASLVPGGRSTIR